ncbi:MAG: type II secretory ATPase GspE/PulE/Tfp pilus assembly ATPase PilB-like protein [Candidatus Azotimanducaceae bacterium]|jgi:type II secretory ATPase GspE/PulE/Tfp pilus assembly ATPase PilB-like protein
MSTAAESPKMRLGDRLVQMGLISHDQVTIALIEQKKTGKMIGQALIDLGFISDNDMREVLGETLGRGSIDLSSILPDADAVALISKQLAQRHNVVPVNYNEASKSLMLAMTDIYDVMVLDRINANIPADITLVPVLASESDISRALDQFYGYEMSVDGILKEVETGVIDYDSFDDSADEYSQPIVRLVDALLSDAVKREASDIHFEPEASFLRLRYRIDGVLMQIRSLHKDYWSALSVRLKVMAGLNIAENRVPQDGRISLRVGGRIVDFRVSVLPTMDGENIVLRVLDRAQGLVELEAFGLPLETLTQLKLLMSRPEGIILVTGPTGSGKTTTLYSMLNYLNSIEVNIMTLEDPVEYPIDMIRQTSINEVSKMDFASGIRSIMRQDPDIILVGEVRDGPTAEMAFRAAMTGHRVFTTLHTNSAIGAIPRLVDIGVPQDILAGNIIGIIGQRLIRLLCEHCKEARISEEFEQIILGSEDVIELYSPVGCKKCSDIGYRGRTLVMEVLTLNEELDEMISTKATMQQFRKHAKQNNFKTMSEDGLRLVKQGRTTIEELSRVVDLTAGLS